MPQQKKAHHKPQTIEVLYNKVKKKKENFNAIKGPF